MNNLQQTSQALPNMQVIVEQLTNLFRLNKVEANVKLIYKKLYPATASKLSSSSSSQSDASGSHGKEFPSWKSVDADKPQGRWLIKQIKRNVLYSYKILLTLTQLI